MSIHNHTRDLRWGLSRTTYLYSPLVFDPILTPLFATMGFSTVGIAGTSITAASLMAGITTTAITFGLQMLLAPKPPKPEDGKAPRTQAIPYRHWCVGRNRMAGAYMLWEARGPNLFAVQAIAAHRVKSYNKYWLHDDEVTIDEHGVVQPSGASGRYRKGVKIFTRLGATTETPYEDIVAGFADEPSSNRAWTNDHRGDGQASVAMIAAAAKSTFQQKVYPYGPPSLSVEVDGAYCWDFRSEDQDPTDEATWTWTRNAAVILAWHLCFSEFGERLDYRKALLPVIDLWKEEADVCDERVLLAGGGDEARYECSGWDTTENSPKVAQNAILASCDGHLVARGDGARILTVGKFRESRCATLTDADIVGHQVMYDVLFEDDTNRLIPKFTYPATDYATSDADFFEDTDAQLEAGRVLAQEAEYTWVHQWRQARRLGLREWKRLRQKVRGSIDVNLSGINAVYHRWVRLDTPIRLPRLDGAVIENRRSILAVTRGAFTMDFVKHPADIDAWAPSVDEGQQPSVGIKPSVSDIVTPVINLVQAKQRSGSVYLRIVIIDPEDDSLIPIARYRVADADGLGTPGAWVEQEFPDADPDGGFVDLATNVVPSDQVLDVEVSFKTSKANGDWTVTASVISTSDPIPPGVATLVSAIGGTGEASYTWKSPNSPNYSGVRLYWNTVNSFGTASYQGPPEYGSPNKIDVRVVTSLPAGTLYGWVQTVNGSGVVGTEVATGSFVVT